MPEDKAAHIKFYVQQSHPSEMKDGSQYPLTFKERTIFHSWPVLQEIPKDFFRLKLKRLKQALCSNLHTYKNVFSKEGSWGQETPRSSWEAEIDEIP